MTGGAELVVVATAPDGVSGAMLAGALESAGIPVQIRGAGATWLFPGAGGGLGAVQVLVPGSLAEEALAILDELEASR